MGHLSVICTGNTGSYQEEQNGKWNFYLIDFLGSGTTSKAYRAVTEDGDECVLKIYVRRYDEDEKRLIPKDEFTKIGSKAVEKEVENFHKLYPELKQHVFSCQLNGYLNCVVHPYFQHVEDRSNKVTEEVGELLEANFAPNKLRYDDTDIEWRHVGRYELKYTCLVWRI